MVKRKVVLLFAMVALTILATASIAYSETLGFQAENATLSGTAVKVTDAAATPLGGTNNTVRISDTTGTVSRTVTTTELNDGIEVWARRGANGSPYVRVFVDDEVWGTQLVTSGSYQPYFFGKDIPSGTHTIKVRAPGTGSGSLIFVDKVFVKDFVAGTTPPDTTISSGPVAGSEISSQNASFSFTSSESGSTFECKLDTDPYSSCTSPKSYTGLAYGSHTFSVRARGTSGNLDATPASRTFSVAAPIALGTAIVGGYPNYPLDPKPLDDFVTMTGKTPAMVNWFQDWSGGFVREHFEDVSRRGAMPMVTWEPKNYPRSGSSVNQPDYALRTIIAGQHDTYIRNYARESAAWGKPMYMRFAHEMNGNWYPWAAGVNGNTSAEYVAAWRHVHDIFRQEGATNVKWVWAPNYHYAGLTPFAQMYPGDAYVDWVGIDGYNFGGTGWISFSSIFGSSYNSLAQMTNKPMMIAETASAEAGGDKAAWIRQAFLKDVPANFPRIKAVMWFNINLERDWHVNSSPTALDAYKEVVASPTYQGKMN